MKFLQTIITGDLILIKTNIPTRPPCPVIARSATPVAPRLIRLVLWLATLLSPLAAPLPHLWAANKVRFAVLTIVVVALVEVLAQSHVDKCLGVMA